jgi:RNA polymerase sigma-70 factor (ECF subfamily)
MSVRSSDQHRRIAWLAEGESPASKTPALDAGSYGALDEIRLVEIARSDPEAFGELYRRNADRIYTYVFYRVGSIADAEDLTARTFYQALGGIHRYVDQGVPFVAWLYRIAHNLVANYHRSRARWKETSLDQLEIRSFAPMLGGGRTTERPDRAVEATERQRALMSAIRRQPEERQRLLILKFTERLSNEEIGQIMGRTESSIKSLYFRTLRALRADLEARGW